LTVDFKTRLAQLLSKHPDAREVSASGLMVFRHNQRGAKALGVKPAGLMQ